MSRQDRVGYGLHSVIDTPPATVLYSPPVNEVDGDMDRATMEDNETTGTRASGRDEYGGRIYKKGIQKSVRPASIGPVLTAFFGPPITTVLQAAAVGPPATPAVYQHVWDFLGTPQFFALWTANRDVSPVIVDKFVGGLGNELELRAEVNNYLKAQAGMFFRDLIQNAAEPAFTQDAGRKFPFSAISAQLAVAGGALSAIQLRDWRFSFNQNLEDDQFALGTDLVDSIPLGPEAGGTARFRPMRDISGWYRRALANTPEDVRLVLTALGPVITGTHNYKVVVDLPTLQTVTAPKPLNGNETLRDVEVTAKVVFDDVSASMGALTLVNTEDGTKYAAAA